MSNSKKILVIDDEADTLTYFSSLLQDNGFSVETASNGDEGLTKARNSKFDAITLDVTMPETSGVRCYRSLREDPDLKQIPVIIITGVSEDFKNFISSRKQVSAPEGYLAKPIDPKEMIELLKQITGQ